MSANLSCRGEEIAFAFSFVPLKILCRLAHHARVYVSRFSPKLWRLFDVHCFYRMIMQQSLIANYVKNLNQRVRVTAECDLKFLRDILERIWW
jgi:hypothetical protein